MSKLMRVAVVIPFYKAELNTVEERSFKQCQKILSNYDIIFALPENIEVNYIPASIKTEIFDKEYFKNIKGYNQLMLSPHFYERFLDYEYILIYQLDSFVFRDELKMWCEKNYDYIGAPWIATNNFVSRLLKPFNSESIKRRKPIFYKVGNGGFSLRKTRSFYNISAELASEITQQLESKQDEIYSNEDVFWSLKVPRLFPDFKIPEYREALGFAIDRKPKIALKINDHKLPFGCHGIDKPKVRKFWEPIVEKEFRNSH